MEKRTEVDWVLTFDKKQIGYANSLRLFLYPEDPDCPEESLYWAAEDWVLQEYGDEFYIGDTLDDLLDYWLCRTMGGTSPLSWEEGQEVVEYVRACLRSMIPKILRKHKRALFPEQIRGILSQLEGLTLTPYEVDEPDLNALERLIGLVNHMGEGAGTQESRDDLAKRARLLKCTTRLGKKRAALKSEIVECIDGLFQDRDWPMAEGNKSSVEHLAEFLCYCAHRRGFQPFPQLDAYLDPRIVGLCRMLWDQSRMFPEFWDVETIERNLAAVCDQSSECTRNPDFLVLCLLTGICTNFRKQFLTQLGETEKQIHHLLRNFTELKQQYGG